MASFPPDYPASAATVRSLAPALAAALCGGLLLKLIPALELALFARGAAELAGLFTGTPVVPINAGWLLPSPALPVAVTAACSATDFFLMVAALVSWQLARHGQHPVRATLAGLGAALPLAIFLNALRIVAVSAAHRWFIPLLPDAYGSFLHLLTGAAVFLPALIALNLLLESHGRPRLPARP